jgi:uncharacterized protein YgiM (DUF1202 family)
MSKYFLFVVVLFLVGCANISPMTDTAPPPTNIPTDIPTETKIQIPTSAPSSEVTVGVVVVDVLNIREGPGTSFPTVGSLNRDEKFYILGERINNTNNKWLLISLSDNSFGWIAGDQSFVTFQKETVDFNTYSTWQKNKEAAQSVLATFTSNP